MNKIIDSEELIGLNDGLTNLGFDLYEAIMESIEDSIDANANSISINIFNEEIETTIGDKNIKSDRLSYIIGDNGSGIENLKELFNFGEYKEERFKNIEELKTKNGIYHYGAISHLNVGVFVTLYSKVKNEGWKMINVYYDQYKKKAFIDNQKYLDEDNMNQLKVLYRDKIPTVSGSIIYVRGINKDNIIEIDEDIVEDEEEKEENLYENDSIGYIKDILSKKIGIKYKVSLEDNVNPIKITINNINVVPKDIFLNSMELPENLRTNNCFATYKISLKHIIDKLQDDIKAEILFQRYGNLFESKEELLEECIEIDFYALSNEYKSKKIQKKYIEQGYLVPSPYYSGLFVRRNNIYMGNTAKIMNLFNFHPSFNTLRGEIRFSPLFDDFFGIQINKNKYRISNVLEYLIEQNINNDNRLIGRTAKAKIKNALKGNFNKENIYNDSDSDLKFTKDTNEKLKALRIEIKKYIDYLSNNLINLNISDKLKEELNRLSRVNIKNKKEDEVKELIKNIKKEVNKYKKVYKKLNYDFLKEYKVFENRVQNINESKKLNLSDESSEICDFLEGIKEPQNEAEMYGLLLMISKLNPERFEFSLIDYDYKESIDNLIEVTPSVFEYLQMEKRFNGQIEDINDIDNILSDNLDILDVMDDKKYCFMELKMELPRKMDHPMRFVSHIVCWKKNNIETMDTEYISYDIDNEQNMVLFNNEPRVKIIYLKEILEEELMCKFE